MRVCLRVILTVILLVIFTSSSSTIQPISAQPYNETTNEVQIKRTIVQPVQSIYQQSPGYDEMEVVGANRIKAKIPLIKDKDVRLFGYPFETDRFNLVIPMANWDEKQKQVKIKFWSNYTYLILFILRMVL